MYHFNENNLVAGYIKELLYNFNLPTCEVYKDGITEVYSNTNYIYNNSLVLTKDSIPNNTKEIRGNYTFVSSYVFGQKILNITKRLKLNSILYDTYTHEYLGDYLRFYRDFKGVDLMMLYNCFSNNLINNLYYGGGKFDTQDPNYKIYMVPVKFNKRYLIGIDNDKPIELACGLFKNNNQITLNSTNINTNNLFNETYKLLTSMQFNSPYEYSTTVSVDADLKSYEPCLKLFIKLPIQNTSSISIIEVDGAASQYKQKVDGSIPNITLPNNTGDVDYPSKLSLFKINDGVSYPFADRLLEFLFGQAIDSTEMIGDNIEMVQDQLISPLQYKRNGVRLKSVGHYGVWDDTIRQTCYMATQTEHNDREIIYNNDDGAIGKRKFINNYYDITGYVDKDIEKLITVVGNW